MNNGKIAEILQSIGDILEVLDENPFKVRAYRNAARTVEALPTDLKTLIGDRRLTDIPGIGKALEEKITELVTTGRMEYFERLRQEVPEGVIGLMTVPSLGPKKAKALWRDQGISSVEELRKACLENRIAGIKGFGAKTQEKILKGIGLRDRYLGQHLVSEAMPVARRLLAYVQECPDVVRSSLAGSIRRWKEVVRDIDLLASSAHPERVMEHFAKHEGIIEVIGRGETKTSVRLAFGLQVDLRVVSDEEFPTALAYFTGSKEHNVALRQRAQKKGLKLSEYGLFKGSKKLECASEERLYELLDLPYIPPEMRENAGELELKEMPQLVGFQSLKGVFHTHSTWSDGTADIVKMAEKARSMGLQYMGLSDHSKTASYANGLNEERLVRQWEEIDRLNAGWSDFRILKGLECDILPSGDLDLTPEILGRLDFLIGSIHSRFDMPEKEMTERVCRAMANPHLDMLGHPTGRLLLSREGYRINLEEVLQAAVKHDKLVEVNAYPNRLDLDWIHCRRAKELGVMVAVNPDAHSTKDLENIEFGLATARKGGLEETDILNTRTLDEVLEILKS